MVKFFISN